MQIIINSSFCKIHYKRFKHNHTDIKLIPVTSLLEEQQDKMLLSSLAQTEKTSTLPSVSLEELECTLCSACICITKAKSY